MDTRESSKNRLKMGSLKNRQLFFKNKEKIQNTQIVRQILSHFSKKLSHFFGKGRIVNFYMIDLFTSALSDCQNAFSILCKVFNSVEEVT